MDCKEGRDTRKGSPHTLATMEANAALFIAAHELLDVLLDCELVLDSANRHTNGRCVAFVATLEKVRAAINKTTTH